MIMRLSHKSETLLCVAHLRRFGRPCRSCAAVTAIRHVRMAGEQVAAELPS